jgi:hypothetical protein
MVGLCQHGGEHSRAIETDNMYFDQLNNYKLLKRGPVGCRVKFLYFKYFRQ